MLCKATRTLKAGAKNFFRNGWLSIATIGVIVIALFIVNVQIAVMFANNLLLNAVEDRVNVSVYVNTDVQEDEIMNIRQEIKEYPEVKSIEYISRKQALADFKERSKNNETILKSIEEIGSNPLGAVLNIKAHDPDQYETIASKIDQASFSEKISRVNYLKYKDIIGNLNREIKSNQKGAIILAVTLSFIAVLITFNSIRTTIYSHRQEIEIMKLIGSSNNYIRFPFIWEGVFYGIAAAAVSVPLTYFYLQFIGNEEVTNSIIPLSNTRFIKIFLTEYFMKNLMLVVLFQCAFGVLLGVFSSVITIRKYLKV
ncbi:MAG: permease-like cell division protein FtsX [Patescibacteria group bacterium]|nr:permease-like cell division protein FtsX [Patescibacteria group bacterium]